MDTTCGFPVPANAQAVREIKRDYEGDAELRLVDINGTKIFRFKKGTKFT